MKLRTSLLSFTALATLGTPVLANCPVATVADPMGLEPVFPQQLELVELQAAASCELGFAQNPAIADLNARILGNADLGPVADRLPVEPLVVMPCDSIGQ